MSRSIPRYEIVTRWMNRKISSETRTWYRRVEESLAARHEERDDDEEAPRENDHLESKWSLNSTDTFRSISLPIRAPRWRSRVYVVARSRAWIARRLFIAHTTNAEGNKKTKERGHGFSFEKWPKHAFPLFLSCTRRCAPRGRLGFADFSDRLASSELLVFLPRVS